MKRRSNQYSNLLFTTIFGIVIFLLPLKAWSGTEHGLIVTEPLFTSSEVKAICKDRKGLMWLGTNNGIVIYNGYETIETSLLRNKPVSQFDYSTRDNSLWVLAEGSIYLIDCATIRSKRTISHSTQVRSVSLDKKTQTLYYSTWDGSIYSVTGSSQPKLLWTTGLPIKYLVITTSTEGFVADDLQLYHIDFSIKKITPLKNRRRATLPAGLWHYDNTILLGSWYAGLRVVDATTQEDITPPQIKKANTTDKRVSVALRQGDRVFTASTNFSVHVNELHGGTHLCLSELYPDIFYGKRFNCMFSDAEHVVWIGTNAGLIKITDRPALFEKMLNNRIPVVSTRSIVNAQDGMYVASYAGIYFQPRGKAEWTNINELFTSNDQLIAPYSMIAHGRYLYIVMESKFLYRYDPVTRSIGRSYYKTDTSKKNSFTKAYCIYPAANGILWLGTDRGLHKYDTTRNTLEICNFQPAELSSAIVKHLCYDSAGARMMAATNKGLFLLKNDGGVERICKENNSSILSNDLLYAYSTKNGTIWIGTKGDGFYKIGADGRNMIHRTTRDGLADDIVYCILEGADANLWMSTNKGLSRYDPKNDVFTNYYQEDGLSNNEFNHNSYLAANNGTLYFGGVNGVNLFQPSSITKTHLPFSIFVSGVKKITKKGDELVPVTGETAFRKSADELSIGILLGTSDYTSPEKTTFFYKIEGLTKDWTALRATHTLRLDGLPFGTYKVSLRALNFRGEFSKNTLHIKLELAPPFYYTWWFLCLCMLTVAGVASIVFSYKMRSMRKYQQLRIQIASDLHDEVGSFLTSIGMYSDNLKYSNDEPARKEQKIEKIADLSRTAILSMRDILWSIDARNDAIGNLVDHIRNHAEEMLLPKNITIQYNFAEEGSQELIDVKVRQHLYLIMKEAINNIAKHSHANFVKIDLRFNRKHFDISIENNGVPANRSKVLGQGQLNMRARAKKINANIDMESQNDMFTVRVWR